MKFIDAFLFALSSVGSFCRKSVALSPKSISNHGNLCRTERQRSRFVHLSCAESSFVFRPLSHTRRPSVLRSVINLASLSLCCPPKPPPRADASTRQSAAQHEQAEPRSRLWISRSICLFDSVRSVTICLRRIAAPQLPPPLRRPRRPTSLLSNGTYPSSLVPSFLLSHSHLQPFHPLLPRCSCTNITLAFTSWSCQRRLPFHHPLYTSKLI